MAKGWSAAANMLRTIGCEPVRGWGRSRISENPWEIVMVRHDWMDCTHIFTFCEMGRWKMLVTLWFEPAVLLKAFVKNK